MSPGGGLWAVLGLSGGLGGVFQEYPRHLHRPGGTYLVVQSDEERDAALADGWTLTPGGIPPPPPADPPKRRPGRPPKVRQE